MSEFVVGLWINVLRRYKPLSPQLFLLLLSLLSFWNSHYAYFDMSDGIPQVSEALLISLLFFGLDNLN